MKKTYMYNISGTFAESILIEFEQSADEGRMVQPFTEEAKLIFETNKLGYDQEDEAKNLAKKLKSAPVRPDFPYIEPAELEDIKKERPTKDRDAIKKTEINPDAYYNKVYGAWLGRCSGCLLGKPVEFWLRDKIVGMLKDTDNYPIDRYLTSNVDSKIKKKYFIVDELPNNLDNPVKWINNVSCGPEDDDTNYTILYLKTIETYGKNFTSEDVSFSWLMNLTYLHTYTAERAAYRNFINNIPPPLSGSYDNPCREWIGAQIRADCFGYIALGDTEKAAEYAWRDGRISHIKNGIYGEMFVAAMIARAAVSSDIQDIIRHGLGEIPKNSRLTEAIEKVFDWYYQGIGWEEAIDNIYNIYDEKNIHHKFHTLSNAMICIVSLLWGQGDFEKTIGISVCAALDTDCNAATTGSIIGMILGADHMPPKWISPLNGKIISGVNGFNISEISDLARRTVTQAFES